MKRQAALYLGTQSVLLNDATAREFNTYISVRAALLLNSAIAAIKAAKEVQRASDKEEFARAAIEHCNQVLEPMKALMIAHPHIGTLESLRELSDADRYASIDLEKKLTRLEDCRLKAVTLRNPQITTELKHSIGER